MLNDGDVAFGEPDRRDDHQDDACAEQGQDILGWIVSAGGDFNRTKIVERSEKGDFFHKFPPFREEVDQIGDDAKSHSQTDGGCRGWRRWRR